jgi:TPR repeat protein
MYQHGRGVPQNDEEAIKWYRKAAEGGYSAAQDNLDWMYQNGRDVKQT